MSKRPRDHRPATPPRTTGWGGRRAGAGRPRLRTRQQVSEPHRSRPAITSRHPIHITARFNDGVRPATGTDRAALDAAIARALRLTHERGDLRILDVRVDRAAIHLLVEATDKRALARGMQGFQISAARAINRLAKRRGGVFADRYRVSRAVVSSSAGRRRGSGGPG